MEEKARQENTSEANMQCEIEKSKLYAEVGFRNEAIETLEQLLQGVNEGDEFHSQIMTLISQIELEF